LTKLEKLSLYSNEITDVTPLAGLTKLEVLSLGWNYQLTDITPLAKLTQLKRLVVFGGGNQIADLTPLAGLTNLTELVLGDNPIPKQQIEMLKKALPNCIGF